MQLVRLNKTLTLHAFMKQNIMQKLLRLSVVILLFSFPVTRAVAQASLSGANVITSAVPFLTIAPDSRAAGMGDIGAATTPDVNSQHWNPAKYAFIEGDMGVALSYSPWLRQLVNDINLAYLVGYKRLDEFQVLSASLRYFSLGDIIFYDEYATYQGSKNPNEFAIDFGYSRLLTDAFSGSVAIRYIRSDLTSGQMINGVESYPGNSFSSDVAFYYQKEFFVGRQTNHFSAGINVSNIGFKISYTDGEVKDFIPTNLRLGAAYTTELDDYNSFSFLVDANKLLVMTAPKYEGPAQDGGVIFPGGINSDKSVVAAMFASFSDAPGGFKEELQEINLAAGVEYWYNKQFALRAGYFWEHENKGNRKFMTAGAGLKLNVFALDFAYLLPVAQHHPLANTLRFTLAFDVDAFTSQR